VGVGVVKEVVKDVGRGGRGREASRDMTLKREAKDRKRINILETEERGMSLAPREKSHVRRRVGRARGLAVSAVRCSDRVAGGARRHLIVTGICRLPVTDRGRKSVGVFDGEALPTLG
jgi:hypothetical protein